VFTEDKVLLRRNRGACFLVSFFPRVFLETKKLLMGSRQEVRVNIYTTVALLEKLTQSEPKLGKKLDSNLPPFLYSNYAAQFSL